MKTLFFTVSVLQFFTVSVLQFFTVSVLQFFTVSVLQFVRGSRRKSNKDGSFFLHFLYAQK